MQKTPQCSTFKIATCENFRSWKKKQKQNFSGEHLKDDKQLALPPRRPKHGLRFLNSTAPARQESVRNWAVRASGASNMEKRLWLVETSFDVLWSAVKAEAARATIGSPLYPCQTYFPLLHGNGCHPMLKSKKRRILWAKKIKFENLVDFQLVGPLKRIIIG